QFKVIPTTHALIASMSAFFMSALLHEFLIFMYLPGQGFGENTAFFLLQGLFCFMQIYLQRLTGFGKTWGTGVAGNVVGWTWTIGLLVWMSPLFVGPYARSGVFVDDFVLPIPPVVMELMPTQHPTGIQQVPPWIYSPTIFFVIPVIHFILLRFKTVSGTVATSIAVVLLIGFPLLFPCSDYLVYQQGAFTSMITFVLRALEIGTFPREVNSKFSVIDYAEFLATSDNTPLRAMRAFQEEKLALMRKELKLPVPSQKWKPHSAAAKDRDLVFYVQLIVRVAVTIVAYSFALAYLEKSPYEPRYGFMSPFDFKGVVDHAMIAVLLYGVLDLGNTVTTIAVAIILQTPYVTIFNHPYLATSLRDFWSHRWNYMIKETLHHLSFQPTLDWLRKASTPKGGNPLLQKPTTTQIAIASMAAFLMSAFLHEYLIFLFVPNQPLGENTVFFIIQGILCYLQVRSQKATGFGISWGTGLLSTVFAWVCTMVIMTITCPLFIGPYARSGLLLKYVLPVPKPLVEFFLELL
ncbi:UNVERIFIED_CONTAM: hypothetical protein HDU68_000340, partial [Siphonaria sp. JEL0065]